MTAALSRHRTLRPISPAAELPALQRQQCRRESCLAEMLEPRCLLTGQISGSVFNDLNANGQRDGGEPGLGGWTVFLDVDFDSKLDVAEISTPTGVDGAYQFAGVDPSLQHVAIIPPQGWQETSPSPGRLFVARSNSGSTGSLYEIDPTTGAQLNQFSPPVGGSFSSFGAALGPAGLFYAPSPPTGLYDLNPDSGLPIRKHASVPTASTIGGMGFLNGLLYLSVPSTHQIIVFNPATDSVVQTLSVAANISGGFCGASDLGLLFATEGNNKINVIDPSTGGIIRSLTPSIPPFIAGGLAYVNGQIIVPVFSGSVAAAYRIDAVSGAVLGQFPLPGTETSIVALAGDGSAQRTVDLSISDTSDVDFGAAAVSAPTSPPDLLPSGDTGTYNFDNVTTLVSGSTTFRVYNTVPGATVTLYNGIASARDNPWGTAIATGSTTDITMTVPQGFPVGSFSSYPFTVFQTEPGKLPSSFPPGTGLWAGPSGHNAVPPDLVESSDTGTSQTDNVTADNTPTFAGAANDGETVRLYDNGVEVGSATAVNGAYSVTASARSDGTHSMTVKLFNNVFQYAVSDAQSITIRTVAPSVTSSSYNYNGSKPAVIVGFGNSDSVSQVWGSLTLDDFQVTNRATGMPLAPASLYFVYSSSGNSGTVTFPGYPQGILPDGEYRATLSAAGVSDTAGNPLAADYSFDFFVLAADANRDQMVDTQDFNLLAASFGGSSKTFSQGNLNYDSLGKVDSEDFNLFISQYGKKLPPPAGGTPVAAGSLLFAGVADDDENDSILCE